MVQIGDGGLYHFKAEQAFSYAGVGRGDAALENVLSAVICKGQSAKNEPCRNIQCLVIGDPWCAQTEDRRLITTSVYTDGLNRANFMNSNQ
jgi:hypothetical protein